MGLSMSNKAAIYVRLSASDQKGGDTIQSQIDTCQNYADQNEYKVIKVYVDDGVSGAELERPGLNEALEDAQAGKYKHLIMRSQKRFARTNVRAAYFLEAKFLVANIKLHYVLGGGALDPTDPAKFWPDVVQKFQAQQERADIRRRTQSGRKRSAKRGNVLLGADVPYGYEKVKDKDSIRLEVIETEAIVVRRIFKEYIAGRGFSRIALELNKDGIPRHVPGPWERWSIRSIIERTDYKGVRYYGVRHLQEDGTTTFLDVDDPRVIKQEVPRIVDDETWDRASKKRESEMRKAAGYVKNEYLLKGRITCLECGSTYLCRAPKSKYFYYNHSFEHKDCPNAKVHFRCEVLDDLAMEFVIEHYTKDEPDWTVIHIENDENLGNVKAGIAKKIENLKERKKKFQIMRADDEISAADLSEHVKTIDAQRDYYLSELNKLDQPDIIQSSWEPTTLDIEMMEYQQFLHQREKYFDKDEWFEIIDYFDLRIQIVKRDNFILTGRLGEIVVGGERAS